MKKAAKNLKNEINYPFSACERTALEHSGFEPIYQPEEKIPSIIVDNFPSLGRLAAFRFLEWVQENPEGVISLPTGKTPEYFIKFVRRYLQNWERPDIRAELEAAGLNPAVRPETKGLHFVQIDEFYPMDSVQENSFNFYVRKFYLTGFGLDASRALLIDCNRIGLDKGQTLKSVWPDGHVDLSLRYRRPRTHLEESQKALLARVDQWCMQYEDGIRELGGIGFFLGGIGPDGHIGFNIAGSDHHATTRLCPVNYETQAAAATDLGGMEIARGALVITIGLDTITSNPDCTAIVIAAGEAKAPIVTAAIESEASIEAPATSLHKLPRARFFLTQGAASKLRRHKLATLSRCEEISDRHVEEALIHVSHIRNRPLVELSGEDLGRDPVAGLVLERRRFDITRACAAVRDSLITKIQNGMKVYENSRFLHTEPHHDDVMLGYFAYVVRHFRRASNEHSFMTLTSGFTSVTNMYMLEQVRNLQRHLLENHFQTLLREGYFDPANRMNRNRDVWQFLDGVALHSEEEKNEGCARRLLRNLFELYDESFSHNMTKRLDELAEYFASQYPGKHDPRHIQVLKGMCREWEAECLWGYYGWNTDRVHHLRLGFYTGDIFTQTPTPERDVVPIVKVLDELRPDIITVAYDPESSGPDTHYKVLQALAEAVKIYEKNSGRTDLKIWGYRNVWYRFDPSEVNIFVPVSLCMLSVMQEAFLNAFLSQKNASFPSYEHDGPFSELAQKIQVEQYQLLKTCLGREWFHGHESPLIRATRGFVFLKEMDTEEFYSSCRDLKRSIEEIGD